MEIKEFQSSVFDTPVDRQGLTSKQGATIRTDHVSGRTSEDSFDGTATLTVGNGTVLIPAPTADPRGKKALFEGTCTGS